MGLSEDFRRQAERFRRIEESQSSRQVEYTDACASAFGLFDRLKAEGDLPHINLLEWAASLGDEYVPPHNYEREQLKEKTESWEIQMMLLCQRLPDTAGLPFNVMLFEQPDEQSSVTLSHSFFFRRRAGNFALICEWLAENLIESSDSAPPKTKEPRYGRPRKFDSEADLALFRKWKVKWDSERMTKRDYLKALGFNGAELKEKLKQIDRGRHKVPKDTIEDSGKSSL